MWTRVITGLILAVAALSAVFGFNDHYFAIFCAVIISLATLEWFQFARLNSLILRTLYMLVMWGLMFIAWYHPLWVAVIGTAWWVLAIVLLWLPMNTLNFMKSTWFLIPAGYLILLPTWSAITAIHQEHGHLAVLYVVAVIALSDTGAYFAGSKFGKHKLAPSLSPKKTYEGLVGGVVLAIIGGVIISAWSNNDHSWLYFSEIAVVTLLVVIVGAFGDLFESLIKRQSNIKDSGSILPGHGGVLDRIDSLCAALPVFALLQLLVGFIR